MKVTLADALPWLVTVGTLLVAGGLVVRLKRRVETLAARLDEGARTDPVTGLLNRRGFERRLRHELERTRRGSGRLSLVLLDLDHFEIVGGRLGHTVGDGALERLGAVLVTIKRRIDSAARLGGQEFALLLPESNALGAFALCERIRTRVLETYTGDPLPLTVSLGTASFPLDGTTAAELLAAADRALHEAKRLGSNRTVAHSEIARAPRAASSGAA
jgi:diguanylate cyclase (GGDEF)-like protein